MVDACYGCATCSSNFKTDLSLESGLPYCMLMVGGESLVADGLGVVRSEQYNTGGFGTMVVGLDR